jgi:hypothetical protein
MCTSNVPARHFRTSDVSIRFLFFTMSQKIEDVTKTAMEAFWNSIASQFPNAKTGDLSPDATVRLENAAEHAVSEWIDNNARPMPTSGPWFVDRQSPYSPLCIKPYPGAIVCDIHGANSEAHANARLIASAPELLSACQGICGLIYRDKSDCETIDLTQYEDAESSCLQAIAKAVGVHADA